MGIYSVETGEAHKMMQRWDNLEKRTLDLSAKIPDEARDAFYQLVEYPAVASAGVAKIYLAATFNQYYARRGNSLANGYADMAKDLFERDKILTDKYNNEIAGGKWRGMMLDKHIGYSQWSMPEENTLPDLTYVDCNLPCDSVKTVSASEISVMAHDFDRNVPADGKVRWRFLPGLGRGVGNMGIEPVTAESRPDGDGPSLEFDINFDHAGKNKLALGILPTNDINPARGLRVGVKVDDGELQTIDARQGYVDTFSEYTEANLSRSGVLKKLPHAADDIYLSGHGQRMRNEIFDNIRWLSIDLDIPSVGMHTLKIVMVDPEIVVEKLVINPDNSNPSYYGSGE